jgi:hypothetical protein
MRLITRDEPWEIYDEEKRKRVNITRNELKRLDMHFLRLREDDKCDNISIFLVNQTYKTYEEQLVFLDEFQESIKEDEKALNITPDADKKRQLTKRQ